MNLREAAEESAAYRTAVGEVAGRNASGNARGAASAASEESHCIGEGARLIERMIERGNLNADDCDLYVGSQRSGGACSNR